MRRILIGVAVVALLVVAFFGFRHVGNKTAQNGIDQALANLPPGYTATHGATSFDALTGELTIHDFALSRLGTPLWSAGKLALSGADQNALRDVFDPTAYPNGHPAWTDRRKLIAHFEADDVVIPLGDPKLQPAHIKRVSLDQLSGRPFAMPPTPENRGKPEFQADAALALSVKAASVEDAGISAAVGANGMAGQGPADHGEVGAVTVSGYDAGRLDRLEIRDVAFETTETTKSTRPATLTVARLAVGTLDAQKALSLVQGGSRDQQAEFNSMRLSSADLAQAQLVVKQGPLLSIGNIHLLYTYGADGNATTAAAVKDLLVSVHETPLSGDMPAIIHAFGSDKVVLDVALDGTWNKQAGTMQFSRYDYNFHDLGTLHMAASVSGVPSTSQVQAAGTQAAKLSAIMQARIDQAQITWSDRGLVNRLLAVAAEKSGTTPDMVRGQLAMPLVTLGLMLPDQPDVADQVTAFLNDPKVLAVTIAPPAPVTLAQVAAASMPARAHLLGLHIEGK